MVWRVSAAMIGSTSSACAMIIAFGENRMPRNPSGPERDSSRKTARPTTTGGRPMNALMTTTIAVRPGKLTSARNAPSGSPTSAASSHRRETDVKRQRHDGVQLRIARTPVGARKRRRPCHGSFNIAHQFSQRRRDCKARSAGKWNTGRGYVSRRSSERRLLSCPLPLWEYHLSSAVHRCRSLC